MPSDVEVMELPDGRDIEVLADGPADGLGFVFHFGTPGVAMRFEPALEAAGDRGLRTVVMTRPGYRGSTRNPGRSVADVVPDTVAVLDELGIGDFVCAGWSGGGPHALACSALLPDRCLATATIAGVAPFDAEGLDWLAGMGPENIEEFGAALDSTRLLLAFLEKEAEEYRNVQADEVAEAFGGLVDEVDRAALTGEFAEFAAAGLRESLRTGVAGWHDDDMAFIKDWGFDLDDVGPVSIWQGAQDRMVPFSHGQWLAEHIPGARAHLYQEHGHLSLAVDSIGEILDDLLSHA